MMVTVCFYCGKELSDRWEETPVPVEPCDCAASTGTGRVSTLDEDHFLMGRVMQLSKLQAELKIAQERCRDLRDDMYALEESIGKFLDCDGTQEDDQQLVFMLTVCGTKVVIKSRKVDGDLYQVEVNEPGA